ncbi:hypothetical protein F2Q70_00016518 [Brassica cretica]|uniref:Uncharacterized protein n=1 Tax=Brassica cretica TaxID=69181 RepID=A0A8S9I1K7_BRACR|nr:hypothetical protein F2Q70_00016518 [Brassica cretica]
MEELLESVELFWSAFFLYREVKRDIIVDEELEIRSEVVASAVDSEIITGTYIFNLGNTCEKLQMAAQVIVAIENPLDIIVQSAMPYGQRAVLKFALELMPLLEGTILTIKEGALGKIRIIAFRDTDSPMRATYYNTKRKERREGDNRQ